MGQFRGIKTTGEVKIVKVLEVKIKKMHPDAVIPSYAKPGDAGMDLTAISVEQDVHGNVVYDTGLAFEIPEGYVGLLFPRSSNTKMDLVLGNSVGVVDSGFRGNVTLKYKSTITEGGCYGIRNIYKPGDRVGQIIILPYPIIQFTEVEELTPSERGSGGYGSTGA